MKSRRFERMLLGVENGGEVARGRSRYPMGFVGDGEVKGGFRLSPLLRQYAVRIDRWRR